MTAGPRTALGRGLPPAPIPCPTARALLLALIGAALVTVPAWVYVAGAGRGHDPIAWVAIGSWVILVAVATAIYLVWRIQKGPKEA